MEDQLELNPNSLNGLTESSALPHSLKEVDDDDDAPVLSSHALAALKEFLSEQQSHHSAAAEGETATAVEESKVSLVSEDWRLSQFWYSAETAKTIAEEYGSDYTFYDYNHPEELPPELKHSFKIVVADPPYLVRVKLIAEILFAEK
ncbi:hypothetical protein AHAS_Ahas12G0242600 [Arachis hypogaea]